MSRPAWIDAGIGAVVIGLTAALGAISAYLAPERWRITLLGLCGGIAVLTAAQIGRAIRSARRHDRVFAELREQQAYLAQPESNRQFDLIWRQQVAREEAENVFLDNFDVDLREAAATRVRCRHCGWKVEKTLLYAREDAVQHYRAWHVPPEPKRRFRWRGASERASS